MWKDKRKEGREAGSLKGRRGREGKEARRVGRKQQSQRDIYTGFTQEPSGRKGNQYLLKVHFTPLVCVCGDLCIHTPTPDKRTRTAFEPLELGAEEARKERRMIDGVLLGL